MNLVCFKLHTDAAEIMNPGKHQERVRTIAPFLMPRSRPLSGHQWRGGCIGSGRLSTTRASSYFPSAQPAPDLNFTTFANSVKAVIDAYNGTVDFYLIDQADSDRRHYRRIFPATIQAVRRPCRGLQKHIRYPEDLFLIQARLYQPTTCKRRRFLQPRRSLAIPPPAGRRQRPPPDGPILHHHAAARRNTS